MAVVRLTVTSKALEGNPLGDPHERELPLIVPDDLQPGESVPAVLYLTGYGGIGAGMLSHDPWQEGLAERLGRLRRAGRIGKLIVALPDGFTRFGGSQYVSSSAHGDYETYLFDECRRAVEARFPVSRWGLAGKSSGGYGALVQAMRRPDRFAAVACHSGDMGFRLAYTHQIPGLMEVVREPGVERWLAEFERTTNKKSPRWMDPISTLALCAAYSPDPTRPLGVALPFSTETWALDEAVLRRWDACDPVELVERADLQANLQKLRLVYVDCGKRDEYHLQWGARTFAAKLRSKGVSHEYEEFDGGHRSTSHRLDVSLPKLWAALS